MLTPAPAIVLDGHQRSALAAVRSLGRLGCRVLVGESSARCLAGSSRFCEEVMVYPDPATQPDQFLTWLENLGKTMRGAVLLPMTDLSVPLVLRSPTAGRDFLTALPTPGAYEEASDKFRLFELARSLQIKVPETTIVSRAGVGQIGLSALRYPVVVKPKLSVRRTGGRAVKRSVAYAYHEDELKALLTRYLEDDQDEVLLQEYIQGTGAGVFALYDHGKPVLFFSHRRVREKPPTGGVSVVCESTPLNAAALQAARRILDRLSWNGVAMVEFKLDADGTPWLIEINARFWGSLQLAVDSGVDFPALCYHLATGAAPAVPAEGYQTGRKLRWLLGDLDNLYATLRNPRVAPGWTDRLAAVARFCVPWQPGMRYEFLRASDPFPAVFSLRDYVSGIFRDRT